MRKKRENECGCYVSILKEMKRVLSCVLNWSIVMQKKRVIVTGRRSGVQTRRDSE